MVVGRDCAAFFVFDAFFLEAALGLASVDRKAGRASSFTESGSVLVPAVVLELGGSATNGAEPEGRSSEADLLPSSDPTETCSDFAASIKARRLCFLGLEMEGDGGSDGEEVRETVTEEGTTAVLISSDGFCFVFFVDGGSEAESRDDNCVAAADTTDFFFDGGLDVTDNACVDFAVSSLKAASS